MTQKTKPATLYQALEIGDIDRMRELLEQGADPNIMDPDYDRYVLSFALTAPKHDAMEMAQMLIDYNADINAIDKVGDTPLTYAAYSHTNALTLLIENGAVLDKEDGNGFTPRSMALGCQRHETVAELDQAMEKQAAPAKPGDLLKAARTLDIVRARALLAQDVDIDERDSKGKTPLMYAIFRGDPRFAKYLIENNADINAIDSEGHTVAMHASYECTDILPLLVKRGADIDIKDKNGLNIMDWLSRYGSAEAVSNLFMAIHERQQASHIAATASQDLIRSQRPVITVRARPAC